MKHVHDQVLDAVAHLNPTEVRTHFEDGTLYVLVVSREYEGTRVMPRIEALVNILSEIATEAEQFLCVEPVTPAELLTRRTPWPS